MAKRDVIAVAVEKAGLRGVRFVLRGRDGWARADGGFWPYEQPEEAEAGAEGGVSAEAIAEEESPAVRAASAARSALGSRQIVLSLPLSRLLVQVMRLPIEIKDDLASAVALQMDKLSPFPGEEMAVGCEVMSETEQDLLVFAAALPEAVFGEIGAALEAAKLRVVRTDATILGWLRSWYGSLQLSRPGRRLILTDVDDGWDLLVLDHGVPVLARGLGVQPDETALIREITLSLLNAELDSGAGDIKEVLVVSAKAPDASLTDKLDNVTGVKARHVVPPDADGGVSGVALRTGERAALDVTPQVWRDALKESRIRRKVLTGVGIAAALWAVFMAVLFAGPAVYRQMTARVREKSRAHSKAYRQVADTRERVNLILSYTDRSRSPLEILRLTSAYLPQGITLIGFNYKREDGVRISGEADQAMLVYDFKDVLTADTLFESVALTGPSISRGKHKFDVDAKFKAGEAQ